MNDYSNDMEDIKSVSSSSGRSDVVYERNRRKKLEEKSIQTINFLTAIILASAGVLTIGIFQYEEYLKALNISTNNNRTVRLCNRAKFANIDIYSSAFSFIITLAFIVFSKRQSLFRSLFKVSFII